MEKGQKAPGFCLEDKDGTEVCLKDQIGTWVVLYFYPRDNTSGCTREAMDFAANLGEFEKMGAVVLGVSPDSIESHAKFSRKHDLSVTLLSDPDHEVIEAYGAWRKKKMYGREFLGVVRSTVLIDPKGTVAHVWPKVRVKGHVEDVKATLREMA
jgi:peroxiredoxin Q/BCP